MEEFAALFDDFWAELSAFLEEINPAVDDRRHGETLHMPVAVSIRHLREVIEERLQLKFPGEKKAMLV
jgi:predicted RNA-binding Zn ribbon-like protein